MTGVIDAATAIMSRSERQIEVAAQNVSNVNTPGYKRRLSFLTALDTRNSQAGRPSSDSIAIDFTPGKLFATGRTYDLAITGPGFLVVGSGADARYSRQGQFERGAGGRLIDGGGRAVQVEGGGDLMLTSGEVQVLEDGSVLEDGAPVAKLAIVNLAAGTAAPADGGYVAPAAAVSAVESPSVRQGWLEASNVTTGAEMVTIMGALRRAETGQRLAGVYDDLMGRVLQAVGQPA